MIIEEEFFKTFGIKSKYIDGENLMEYSYGTLEYPKITDRILLELMRLIMNKGISIYSNNLEDLKNNLLNLYINQKKYFYKNEVEQVQKLFKGGRMNNKIQKLLCFLMFHKWEYNQDRTKRWCVYCGKAQEYWCNIEWCECIDGEPIE